MANPVVTNLQPRIRDYILWIALAATASILLLSVTSQITQEVASIPFLWVLPLTIYLLSFIFAFSSERWYSRQVFLLIFFGSTWLASWALGRSVRIKYLGTNRDIFSGFVCCLYGMSWRVISITPTSGPIDILLLNGLSGRRTRWNRNQFYCSYYFQGLLGIAAGTGFLLAALFSGDDIHPNSKVQTVAVHCRLGSIESAWW